MTHNNAFGQIVTSTQSSSGETFEKAGISIERSPWEYQLNTAGDIGGRYTRLHNVLELIHGQKIHMGGLKQSHIDRINDLGIVATSFELSGTIPLEKRTVSWSDAVSAMGAGMVVNDLLQRFASRDAQARVELNAIIAELRKACHAEGISGDSPIIAGINRLIAGVAPTLPLEVVKQVGVDIDVVSQDTRHQDVIRSIAEAVMQHVSYVDSSYLQRSAQNGTQIHELLEVAARWAIEHGTVEWPGDEINRIYVAVDEGLKEKARVTWEETVKTLNLQPEEIFDVEAVILINHAGERIAGAADMLVLRNDELIIMDWKTGKSVAKAEYQAQLMSYSMASELLTRHGIIEVDNPEARAMVERNAVFDDNELPTKGTATFEFEGRTIRMADYGVLVRTAVDATQDEQDQSPQFWRVNYDPRLRQFVYNMVLMHCAMRDGEIQTRMQRGIERIRSLDAKQVKQVAQPQQARPQPQQARGEGRRVSAESEAQVREAEREGRRVSAEMEAQVREVEREGRRVSAEMEAQVREVEAQVREAERQGKQARGEGRRVSAESDRYVRQAEREGERARGEVRRISAEADRYARQADRQTRQVEERPRVAPEGTPSQSPQEQQSSSLGDKVDMSSFPPKLLRIVNLQSEQFGWSDEQTEGFFQWYTRQPDEKLTITAMTQRYNREVLAENTDKVVSGTRGVSFGY